ncbi:unnamed protein product [Closterium sp. NIES-53]
MQASARVGPTGTAVTCETSLLCHDETTLLEYSHVPGNGNSAVFPTPIAIGSQLPPSHPHTPVGSFANPPRPPFADPPNPPFANPPRPPFADPPRPPFADPSCPPFADPPCPPFTDSPRPPFADPPRPPFPNPPRPPFPNPPRPPFADPPRPPFADPPRPPLPPNGSIPSEPPTASRGPVRTTTAGTRSSPKWGDDLTADLLRCVIVAMRDAGRAPFAKVQCLDVVFARWHAQHADLNFTEAQLRNRLNAVKAWVKDIRQLKSCVRPGVTWDPATDRFDPHTMVVPKSRLRGSSYALATGDGDRYYSDGPGGDDLSSGDEVADAAYTRGRQRRRLGLEQSSPHPSAPSMATRSHPPASLPPAPAASPVPPHAASPPPAPAASPTTTPAALPSIASIGPARTTATGTRSFPMWNDDLTADLLRCVIAAMRDAGRAPFAKVQCWDAIFARRHAQHADLNFTTEQLRNRLNAVKAWVKDIRELKSWVREGVNWDPARDFFDPSTMVRDVNIPPRKWDDCKRWLTHTAPWLSLGEQVSRHVNHACTTTGDGDRYYSDDPGEYDLSSGDDEADAAYIIARPPPLCLPLALPPSAPLDLPVPPPHTNTYELGLLGNGSTGREGATLAGTGTGTGTGTGAGTGTGTGAGTGTGTDTGLREQRERWEQALKSGKWRPMWDNEQTTALLEIIRDVLRAQGTPLPGRIEDWGAVHRKWLRQGLPRYSKEQLRIRCGSVRGWVKDIQFLQELLPPEVTWDPTTQPFNPDPELGISLWLKQHGQWKHYRRWCKHTAPWLPLALLNVHTCPAEVEWEEDEEEWEVENEEDWGEGEGEEEDGEEEDEVVEVRAGGEGNEDAEEEEFEEEEQGEGWGEWQGGIGVDQGGMCGGGETERGWRHGGQLESGGGVESWVGVEGRGVGSGGVGAAQENGRVDGVPRAEVARKNVTFADVAHAADVARADVACADVACVGETGGASADERDKYPARLAARIAGMAVRRREQGGTERLAVEGEGGGAGDGGGGNANARRGDGDLEGENGVGERQERERREEGRAGRGVKRSRPVWVQAMERKRQRRVMESVARAVKSMAEKGQPHVHRDAVADSVVKAVQDVQALPFLTDAQRVAAIDAFLQRPLDAHAFQAMSPALQTLFARRAHAQAVDHQLAGMQAAAPAGGNAPLTDQQLGGLPGVAAGVGVVGAGAGTGGLGDSGGVGATGAGGVGIPRDVLP